MLFSCHNVTAFRARVCCVWCLCCVPCYAYDHIVWSTRAKHLAVTNNGIELVLAKRRTGCGFPCTDAGRESKVPLRRRHLTYAPPAPAYLSTYLIAPRCTHCSVNVDNGFEKTVPFDKLTNCVIKEPGAGTAGTAVCCFVLDTMCCFVPEKGLSSVEVNTASSRNGAAELTLHGLKDP